MPKIDPDSYTGLKLHMEGRVLHAAFNNPAKKNALNATMIDELHRLWAEVDGDDDVYVVVLSGEGSAFCAGIDLSTLARSPGPESQRPRRFSVKGPRDTFWKMLDCEKPIIAKVRGPAYGLGVNICLSADIVIAAENARFCDSHVKNGIAPGDGGAVLWPLLIGFHRAKEYIMLGEPIDGPKAAEIGLINYCVPDEQLDGAVDDMANKLANGAPLAISFAKLSVNVMLKQIMAGAFETSMAYDMLTLRTNDVREGSSAFVEHRSPNFTGT
jgi:enoyl-CoA hydratase